MEITNFEFSYSWICLLLFQSAGFNSFLLIGIVSWVLHIWSIIWFLLNILVLKMCRRSLVITNNWRVVPRWSSIYLISYIYIYMDEDNRIEIWVCYLNAIISIYSEFLAIHFFDRFLTVVSVSMILSYTLYLEWVDPF